jgi:hypothetical protein
MFRRRLTVEGHRMQGASPTEIDAVKGSVARAGPQKFRTVTRRALPSDWLVCELLAQARLSERFIRASSA